MKRIIDLFTVAKELRRERQQRETVYAKLHREGKLDAATIRERMALIDDAIFLVEGLVKFEGAIDSEWIARAEFSKHFKERSNELF